MRGMNKVVIVTMKTRLWKLIERYNTFEQAKFYISHLGMNFDEYVEEDRQYNQSLDTVRTICGNMARITEVDKTYLPNMIFGRDDVVVAVGQDGLVCNILKYLDKQDLIGVNPDVKRYDGKLLPFEPGDLEKILPKTLEKNAFRKNVTLGCVTTNDGQNLLAVNDFFIGCRTHVSARYAIEYGNKREVQSSSGIIVSTGLGAGGWYASVMAGVCGIYKGMDGNDASLNQKVRKWDDNYLTFLVREPFPSKVTGTDICFGQIDDKQQLCISSQMAENGVIFSDGMEEDAITFNAGCYATVGISDKKGYLVAHG